MVIYAPYIERNYQFINKILLSLANHDQTSDKKNEKKNLMRYLKDTRK